MKLYRCMLGVLLVFFVALAVVFAISFYNEQRSTEDGILILHEKVHEGYIQREERCVSD